MEMDGPLDPRVDFCHTQVPTGYNTQGNTHPESMPQHRDTHTHTHTQKHTDTDHRYRHRHICTDAYRKKHEGTDL